MLTRKQHELLMFIHERMKESGVPPSFDEMKDALDLKSKSGIHRLITALEERGFIRRLPNRARAMEVVRLPDSMNLHWVAKSPSLSLALLKAIWAAPLPQHQLIRVLIMRKRAGCYSGYGPHCGGCAD